MSQCCSWGHTDISMSNTPDSNERVIIQPSLMMTWSLPVFNYCNGLSLITSSSTFNKETRIFQQMEISFLLTVYFSWIMQSPSKHSQKVRRRQAGWHCLMSNNSCRRRTFKSAVWLPSFIFFPSCLVLKTYCWQKTFSRHSVHIPPIYRATCVLT